MWIKRRTYEELLSRIRALEAQPAAQPPLESAIGQIATAAITSRAQEMESMGSFLRVVSEIGAERAARALGKRRASTAKRLPNGRFVPKQAKPNCRLCANPHIPNPTSAEITAHATHDGGEITYEDQGDRIVAHVPERLIETTADGHEQIECPECGTNHKHQKTIH